MKVQRRFMTAETQDRARELARKAELPSDVILGGADHIRRLAEASDNERLLDLALEVERIAKAMQVECGR